LRGKPEVIGRSKNLSLLFADAGIVARVTTRDRLTSLRKEADVALHLARYNAPTIRLLGQATAVPVVSGEYAVLFWHHVAGRIIDEHDAAKVAAAARSLGELHTALASYPGSLENVWTKIGQCGDSLRDPSALVQLSDADRSMLLRAFDLFTARANAIGGEDTALHGDAHLGNVVFSECGPVWLDFEDVCRGPREWDYCRLTNALPPNSVNAELFDILLVLRSVCVAVWCWKLADDPAKFEAALEHTQLVRYRLGV
jgi:Ser/Thr protein kinase RdoA (MazF antagonist)